MKVRVLGGGWYGCHLAAALIDEGCQVELHESRSHIFGGASGNIPARLHLGFHYPRSRVTRAACQEHSAAFMARYGHLTKGVPINIYAIAAGTSLIDFDQYQRTLAHEVEFVTIAEPQEFGLANVEGAVLTGERHILTQASRAYFETVLGDAIRLNSRPTLLDDPAFDLTIDCTFCSHEAAGIDRYEPCLVLLLKGPTDKAVTIMDGPFPSLYPWDEARDLCSLSSALWTPFSKKIRTWGDAQAAIEAVDQGELLARAYGMIDQMAEYYPAIREDFTLFATMTSIRAMPLSGADARLVDVIKTGPRVMRVRAGKIDAVLHAEKLVRSMLA